MEGCKRISFSTLEPTKSNVKKVKIRKAKRISINIPVSSEKSCPEYNYKDLISQYLVRNIYLCLQYLIYTFVLIKQVTKSSGSEVQNICTS